MNSRQNMGRRAQQRGFSLIEALIAVIVLATGLLALAALQASLIRNSADAKARSQLAAFGESLLDARRVGGFGATELSIGTGQKLATTAQLTTIANAMGAASVTESTTVTHWVADAAGVFTLCASPCTAAAANPAQYKVVDMSLRWTDASGASRSIGMTTAISPLALNSSKVLVDRTPPDDSGVMPIVRRPTPLTDGMIPIALGDGQDTAATNPKPELVGRNNDTLVSDTRFEILTYNSGDNLGTNGFVRFNKRIETAMVGCTCQTGLGGFPTGGSNPEVNVLLRAKAFRPSYWDGEKYSEPDGVDTVTSSPDISVSQSQLCDVCCRDHKDSTNDTIKFNPWESTHAHYLDPAGTPVTTGQYREACRVIRVNGVWRVTPDPRSENMALLPTQAYPSTMGSTTAPSDNNRAGRPMISTTGRSSYVDYAYAWVKSFFFDGNAAVDNSALQASNGLDAPDYVPIKSIDSDDLDGDGNRTEKEFRWLHARAILADHLEPKATTRITKAAQECAAGATGTEKAQCVLPFVPMASINVTELADWFGRETSETGITHTGSLAAGSTIKNYGQALLRRYVSALALVSPINPTDDDNPLKDEQTFTLTPSVNKSGTWLTVASPSAVIFGDPGNPKRGFASIAAPTPFNVTLEGIDYAHDTDSGNDPGLNVGIGVNPCTPHTSPRGAFPCATDSTTDVLLSISTFNVMRTTNGNINDPCTGAPSNKKIGQGQAVCDAYALTSGVIDGGAPLTPTGLSSTLTSGVAGKPTEIRSVTLPSVRTTSTSEVTLNFTKSTTNATPVCAAAPTYFSGWTCN